EREIVRLSLVLDTRLLYLFAKADILGRIAPDRAQLLEQVEYFRLRCEELECFGRPRVFHSDLARFAHFHDEKDLYYEPCDDTKGTAHLMSGLPGAGKDAYIALHLPRELPVISLDEIRQELKISPKENQGRVVAEARERAKVFLRKGQDFVWNAANITRQVR